MKITRRQLSRLIIESLSSTLDEASRYTGGVQQGDTVWLKDDPNRGKGVVRGKYKDPRIGYVISVQWAGTGRTSSHIPSAITTSQEIATTWESGLPSPGWQTEVSSYDIGREDSLGSVPAQDNDPDYMRGYNDARVDMGASPVEPPGEGSGEPLDPNLLQYAYVGKNWPVREHVEEGGAPPWLRAGYSKFQSDMNDFLDASGYEPGVWYYWENEDIIVALGGEQDAQELSSVLDIGAEQKRWNSPEMNPAVVELEDGNWAVKLNAQMSQDRW
jgi:hypothetical protein